LTLDSANHLSRCSRAHLRRWVGAAVGRLSADQLIPLDLGHPCLWVPKTQSPLCDLGIFADQASRSLAEVLGEY